MLGAIVGDIIGSVREGRKSVFDGDLIVATVKDAVTTQLDPPEPVIHNGLCFTDDSVLTVATVKALREGNGVHCHFADSYADFFDIHGSQNAFYKGPGIGYGTKFMQWAIDRLDGNKRPGYFSRGNGAAMRVSPVAYHFDNMLDVINGASESAMCTHNHSEGVTSAQAVALCIWAARQGASVSEIRKMVMSIYHADLNFDEEKLIRQYVFTPLAKDTVPIAIWAALEGPDFKSVMIRCLKIGGDTDTIAAMAGSISEPLWGLPIEYAQTALEIMKEDGPFMYDEYQIAIQDNPNYPSYSSEEVTPGETHPESLSWFSSLLSSLNFKPKKS